MRAADSDTSDDNVSLDCSSDSSSCAVEDYVQTVVLIISNFKL